MNSGRFALLSLFGLASSFTVLYLNTGSLYTSVNYYSRYSLHSLTLYISILSFYFLACELIFNKIFNEISQTESSELREAIGIKSFDLILTVSLHFKALNFKIASNCIFDLTLTFFHYFFIIRTSAYRQQTATEQKSVLKRQILKGFFFLVFVDLYYIKYLIRKANNYSAFTVEIFFLSEILNLFLQLIAYSIKHMIIMYDESIPEGVGWDYKLHAIFVIDMVVLAFTFLIEFLLFIVLAINFAIPLQVIRKIYITTLTIHSKIIIFLGRIRIKREFEIRFEIIDLREEDEGENRECSICLDDVEIGKIIPCGHFFHTNCLKKWLENGRNCPVCRDDIEKSFREGKRVLCDIRKKRLLKELDIKLAKHTLGMMKDIEKSTLEIEKLIEKKQDELKALHNLHSEIMNSQKRLHSINKY
eukprot:GAHX01001345.1.p1 GENE.GAHX01001345.1~~GAHX01001345.1.p1  ORF type:complete len:429 (+),score=63.01 GAHX01001345.1:37-1287(+)